MFISIIEIVHLISYQLCMTWLNWSLKLHSSLWTIPHLILTHNTQDFVQIMLISFVIVHVQMWCVCSNTCWSNPKRFLSVLYVFSFCSKCIFCFFLQKNKIKEKTSLKEVLREAHNLELPAKCAWGKLKSHIFIQKLSLLPREYFTTKHFSQNGF